MVAHQSTKLGRNARNLAVLEARRSRGIENAIDVRLTEVMEGKELPQI
jgi:hypothetical protein